MLIVWFAAIAMAALLLMPAHLVAFLLFNLIMVVVLLFICYAKGEPPAWRWGEERMRLATMALLGCLLAAPCRYAHAQTESSVTAYGGYRFGGSVTNTTNDSTIDLAGRFEFCAGGRHRTGSEPSGRALLQPAAHGAHVRGVLVASEQHRPHPPQLPDRRNCVHRGSGTWVVCHGRHRRHDCETRPGRTQFRDFFLRQSRDRLDGASRAACRTSIRSTRLWHPAQQQQRALLRRYRRLHGRDQG